MEMLKTQPQTKQKGAAGLTALQLVALLCGGSVPHGVEDSALRRRDGAAGAS